MAGANLPSNRLIGRQAYTDEHSVKVWDRRRIRRHYFMTSFPIDLIAVLPIDVLALIGGARGSAIAWLRLPKLRHSLRLYGAMLISWTNRLVAEAVQLYLTALAIIHLLACLWFFITEGHKDNYQVGRGRMAYTADTCIKHQPGGSRRGIHINLPLPSPCCRVVRPQGISKYMQYGDYTNGHDDGGPLRLHYFLFCFMYVTMVVSGKSWSSLVVGRLVEQIFVIFLLILNLSAWSYIIGLISGALQPASR